MPDPDQLLRSGDIDGARSALIDIVRREPANDNARMFLFQLLAVAGEWEKSQKHLRALTRLDASTEMLAVVYGEAAEAEAQRADVFAGKEPAHQHRRSAWADDLITAIGQLGRGETATSIASRDDAFDAAPDMSGSLNGEPFDWITNADPRIGPCIEMIIDNRYGLQPFDQISRIDFKGPRDLRDLVWMPVEVTFKSSRSVSVLLPARYPGTTERGNDQEKLSRQTSWEETPFGDLGCGTQILTTSSGKEIPLIAVRALVFE